MHRLPIFRNLTFQERQTYIDEFWVDYGARDYREKYLLINKKAQSIIETFDELPAPWEAILQSVLNTFDIIVNFRAKNRDPSPSSKISMHIQPDFDVDIVPNMRNKKYGTLVIHIITTVINDDDIGKQILRFH